MPSVKPGHSTPTYRRSSPFPSHGRRPGRSLGSAGVTDMSDGTATPSVLQKWWRSVRPGPGELKSEAVAGLPGAIGSVPDGMASAVLAGVSPVFGLYASFAGPVAGGLTASTRLMVITTTTASALAAGSVLATVDPSEKEASLFLLVILAGALMVLAGVLKLGRFTRFVSHSVMIGFLTGVAANIIFGQIPDLTGAEAEGATSVAKGIDVLLHPGSIYVPSLLAGLLTMFLLVVVGRTSLAPYASIVALAIPTVLVLVLGVEGVATVEDIGEIPRGVPLPVLPDFSLITGDLILAAFAIAAIVLVQGAGVAESAPNSDGSMSNPTPTSSRRGQEISPPGSSVGCRSEAPSAKRPLTSVPALGGDGRRSSPGSGCW
jgi:sulfate permease, SulP family